MKPLSMVLECGDTLSRRAVYPNLETELKLNCENYNFTIDNINTSTGVHRRWTFDYPRHCQGSNMMMQRDGNLVVYDSYSEPCWASNTAGN